MALFEVQRFSSGEWWPTSAFDERILAVDAAKNLMRSGRPPAAVRVVEDREDGSTPRMLFQQTAAEAKRERMRRVASEAPLPEAAQIRIGPRAKAEAAPPPKRRRAPPTFGALLTRLVFLVGFGFLAVEVLRILTKA
jgi:hypothetical protein